jgi:hypothetical protein
MLACCCLLCCCLWCCCCCCCLLLLFTLVITLPMGHQQPMRSQQLQHQLRETTLVHGQQGRYSKPKLYCCITANDCQAWWHWARDCCITAKFQVPAARPNFLEARLFSSRFMAVGCGGSVCGCGLLLVLVLFCCLFVVVLVLLFGVVQLDDSLRWRHNDDNTRNKNDNSITQWWTEQLYNNYSTQQWPQTSSLEMKYNGIIG